MTAYLSAAPLILRQTRQGVVAGAVHPEGALAWMGVPYAAPPIGPLRWRAPLPPHPWDGIRDASAPGACCMQLSGFGAESDRVEGSEDCLTLNIWAPPSASESSAASQRPVMVWVHGGANRRGQGSSFDAARLAQALDIIVVTVNYRLGVLGWFRHASLVTPQSSPEDRSGNFGTLDIIAALHWVRDNIEGFGGDRGKITLAGHSAGASNILSLIVSPLAQGLFHRVIIQSAYTTRTASIADAENLIDDRCPGHPRSSAELLLQLLIIDGRCADREEARRMVAGMATNEIGAWLRGQSFAQLAAGYARIGNQPNGLAPLGQPPMLFADGVVLPADGIEGALAMGAFTRVPVLIGATRDEYSILAPMFADTSRLLKPCETGFGFVMLDHRGYQRLSDCLSALMNLAGVVMPARLISRHQPGHVFTYRFDWGHNEPAAWLGGTPLGATHGSDIPFLFGFAPLGQEFAIVPAISPGHEDEAHALSRHIMAYWGQFIRQGTPGNGGSVDRPSWPAWTDDQGIEGHFLLLDGCSTGGLRTERFGSSRDTIMAQYLDSSEQADGGKAAAAARLGASLEIGVL